MRALLQIDALTDWSSVRALAPEWDRLLGASSADSPFLSYDWIETWAGVMGSVDPRVVTVRGAAGELLGVAPLYRAQLHLGFVVPVRTLRVLGDTPTSADYPDWPVRAGAEEEVMPALARAVAALPGWDLLWMPRMNGWNGAAQRIGDAVRGAGLDVRAADHPFAYLDLPDSSEAFFGSLSSNKRQQLRRERNRFHKHAKLEILRCEKSADVDRFLDVLFDLHGRRWRERGEFGSFERNPRKAEFYRRFARKALERGWLSLYALRDDGVWKAVQLGYVYGGVFHQIQEGFDPDEQGAGNVLRARVIEDCIESGVRVYDFLAGMSEHKRRWSGRVRDGADLLIGRRTPLARLVFAANLWPATRWLRDPTLPRSRR